MDQEARCPCQVKDFADLHATIRRALRLILNLPEASGRDPAVVLSDLCLCEAGDLSSAEATLQFADERCGARIPLVVVPGPPALVLCQIRDLGAVATWYLRALEVLHGRECPGFSGRRG